MLRNFYFLRLFSNKSKILLFICLYFNRWIFFRFWRRILKNLIFQIYVLGRVFNILFINTFLKLYCFLNMIDLLFVKLIMNQLLLFIFSLNMVLFYIWSISWVHNLIIINIILIVFNGRIPHCHIFIWNSILNRK